MKKIKFECPCCHETIIITLDEQFQIISIAHINKKKFKDIEFGILKEGEIKVNE
jgi:hypothetical protein